MTTERTKKRGLGMGLSALLADGSLGEDDGGGASSYRDLPIEFLEPSPFQPRTTFREEETEELAVSIKARGVLQPLLVRKADDIGERYQIIAGERRWRAAQMAGLTEVPVIVRTFSDGEAMEAALLENVQRLDLDMIEEAQGYQRLMEEFRHTQEALAQLIGKSRSHIANTLRLLALPVPVQAMVKDGRLTAGHARALLSAENATALAQKVLAQGLSVRQTEALVQNEKRPRRGKAARQDDPDSQSLTHDLSQHLGLPVSLKTKGQTGQITISYSTLEQLDGLLKRLWN